jgi:surface antigen
VSRMQSFDNRSRSMSNPLSAQEPGQYVPFTEPLTQENGFASSQNPSGQNNILGVQSPSFVPTVADPFTPLPASNVTRTLTGTLVGSGEAAAQRPPVLIRGTMKKPVGTSQMPHPGRRRIVSMVGVVVLFLVISVSLLTATPLGHSIGLGFTPSNGGNAMQMVSSRNGSNTLNSVVAQATATAVYTNQQSDGYDPSAPSSGSGVGVSVGSGNSPRAWPYGQCTYWANSYYHTLTGWWVDWAGNANQWTYGAGAAGWNVSTQPHVPSIMVLMGGVQGASWAYGHVAVVTAIINSNTVSTSNMNWYGNGGFGIVSTVDFNYGPGYYGVYFVWHS